MKYAVNRNGQIIVGTLAQLFPNTSFPAGTTEPSAGFISEQGLMPVIDSPVFDPETQDVVDIDPPVEEEGVVYTRSAITLTPIQISTRLQGIRATHLVRIDWEADAIIRAAVGDRVEEYRAAEAQALDFASRGFQSPVPPSVLSWVTAGNLEGRNFTPQTAAEDIIQQAAAWRQASETIRLQRLSAKALIRAATTIAAVTAAFQTWRQHAAGIRAALGLPAFEE